MDQRKKMMMISSRQNIDFKKWLSLLKGQGVKKYGEFILSGRKTVPEAIKQYQSTNNSFQLLLTEKMASTSTDETSCQLLTNELFNELDIFGTKSPLFVGQTPSLIPVDLTQKPEGLEVLCALGDPANLGGLIRAAQAFSVSKIILLAESAHPYHTKALRAASGVTLTAPLYTGPSIHDLQTPLIGLDMDGEDIHTFQWPQNCRLLMGEEGPGLLNKNLQKIKIPINPTVDSLNALSATSIALYSYRVQFPQEG